MEQKTIGKFITALRKANGMTQKELAEKLNVSDKTISRWERDEGTPDLSAIPVLAEIFGVTCDELLRGERKPAAERTAETGATSSRGEKQRQRILTTSLSKYRAQSFIGIGISTVGLIVAMICNLGFLRAYIGFFAGIAFYAASAVCQAVFLNGAFLSVSDDAFADADTGSFKQAVIRLAMVSFSLTTVFFGITLPLIVFVNDAYVGLSGSSWLSTGLLYGTAAIVLCCIALHFIRAALVRRGTMAYSNNQERIFWRNHRLQRSLSLVLIALLVVTAFAQTLATSNWNVWALADGMVFQDYESFIQYMEQDIPYSHTGSVSLQEVSSPDDAVQYYDQFGNEITEEEALLEELIVSDGTETGKVVCRYIHRNQNVVSVRPSSTADGLPITVITQQDLTSAQIKAGLIVKCFIALYVLETLVIAVIYWKKRTRQTERTRQ